MADHDEAEKIFVEFTNNQIKTIWIEWTDCKGKAEPKKKKNKNG